jgi:gluconolactonase
VDNYKGKKFNSPNDLVFDTAGNLYFTDPPYGLSEAMMEDPKKELNYQGIFKYDTQGNVKLLTKEVSRPNGLALSPDEQTMYVANSDGNNPVWYAFQVQEDSLINPNIIYDATDLIGKEIGFPDGVKVDPQGNIFTAGPGGIWIFSSDHKLLGKIKSEFWASNCNFDADFSTLYITADDNLLRVKLR